MDDTQTTRKKTRMVDHDHQKYQASAKQQLAKHSETIAALKRDNDELKTKLASTTGTTKKSYAEQDKAQAKQEEIDSLQHKVQLEQMKATDLDKEISVLQMETRLARANMGGVNVTTDNTQAVEKQVRVLENRLDQALVQFNEALAFNRDLRQTIDNLRGERKVFHEIYRKLEGELHEKKKAMADVIERSNRDYEERDALQGNLDSLKAYAADDAKQYDGHFAKLDELLAKYKANREQQQAHLAQQQAQQKQQQQTTQKKDNANEQSTSNNNTSSNQPRATSSEGNKNNNTSTNKSRSNNNNKDDIRSDDASIEDDSDMSLQDIIDELKQATGVQDLDVLHQKFVKSEETNFSMYNFVNELNASMEALEAEIGALREQIQTQRGDAQRRAALKALEDELAATERQQEALHDQSARKKEQLAEVCRVSQELFTKIGCSSEMADELLGTNECTELNMLQFLGIIEHRTNEILCAYNLAAQNEMKRRAQSKDEEARKRRERKQADREARLEAGEVPEDDEDDEDDADKDPSSQPNLDDDKSGSRPQAKFLGVGPSAAHGQNTPQALVGKETLPTTNAGDGTGGDGHGDDYGDDANEIMDHRALREQMEARLQARREKEEKAGRRRRNKKG